MAEKATIAKNSIYLYIRMFIMMGVSLYTSRVVLANLGVEDFGIFGVVGGIAVLFAFFNNALAQSSQRFITVSLSKDSLSECRKVFSMSVNCHLIICLLILLLSETIGLWILNTQLNIPASSMSQANIVYQLCLLSCLIDVMVTPLTGTIIAYEKMNFYALTSILAAALKLSVAIAINYIAEDRLSIYALLLTSTSLLMGIINLIYCTRMFNACKYVKSTSKKLFKYMMSFTGWNLFKMGAVIGVAQGNNILVNIFGGPIASAAMTIGSQVNGAVYSFMSNVQTAFNPQITKYVAREDFNETTKLLSLSLKFSIFLFGLFALPLTLQITPILNLWLTEVPEGTVTICIFSIASVGFDALTGPYNTIIFAKGNIRNFQIWTSIILFLSVPLAWLLLKTSLAFEYILVAKIASQIFILGYAVIYIKDMFGNNISVDIFDLIVKPICGLVLVLFAGLFCIQYLCFPSIANIAITVTITSTLLCAYLFSICLTKSERSSIKNFIKSKIHKRHNQ